MKKRFLGHLACCTLLLLGCDAQRISSTQISTIPAFELSNPDDDDDSDGVNNGNDNCPTVSNADQADLDADGLGDRCDAFPDDPLNDLDGDHIGGSVDNCPSTFNPDQADADGNGVGDACEPTPPDVDGDGVEDINDNCPMVPNDQSDGDGDLLGDACDPFPKDPLNDADGDQIGGNEDNCPVTYNPDQADADGNRVGNLCDSGDFDRDSIADERDNCVTAPNPDQADADGDGLGDKCDLGDFDRDGSLDLKDNCPAVFNPHQEDGDGDGIGDACDLPSDFDRDGVPDIKDNCPRDPNPKQEDTDGDGIGDACESNTAPKVTLLRLPADPIPVGATATIGVDFLDPDVGDKHSAKVDWEIASTGPAVGFGDRSFGASQTFTQAGVYTVVVTVTDQDGASGDRTSTIELPAYIVVYDPSAGFVTGGGWIMSPAGACRTSVCTNATSGKATFGFVSKYHNGATAPSGNTEFHFKAGDLRFSSTSYDWLVVAGNKAKYKGNGTINGAGNYAFMITAIDGKNDGSSDQFRIKIWDLTSGGVVYDNKMGSAEDSDDATAIESGSIVVHNK